MSDTRTGLAYTAGSILLWGCFPVYFKQLEGLDLVSIMGHRVVWALLFLLLVVGVSGRLSRIREALAEPRALLWLLLTSAMLASSWVVYIWAVHNELIIEASLGYFLTPILSVVIGLVLFRERLNPWQWSAVLLAAAGVLSMALLNGVVPWVGIFLGGIFALYSAVRKKINFQAFTGSLIETIYMLPFGLAIILLVPPAGDGAVSLADYAWLAGSGVMTILPLVWYISASRLIPLSVLGTLFYLAPTLGFLSGVFIFGEPFTTGHAVMFSLILSGLTLFTIDAIRTEMSMRKSIPADPSRYKRL